MAERTLAEQLEWLRSPEGQSHLSEWARARDAQVRAAEDALGVPTEANPYVAKVVIRRPSRG